MRTLAPAVLLLLVLAAAPPPPAFATGCAGGPANDCIDHPLAWFATPESDSNLGAGVEPGEPMCGTMHNTVWLKLEVPEPGTWDRFEVELSAPFFATLVAYTRSAEGEWTQHGCSQTYVEDESGAVRQPWPLRLPCTPGATYWIQVGGQSADAAGAFHLRESQFLHFNRTTSEPCPFAHTVPGAPRVWTDPGAGGLDVEWHEGHGGGRGVPNLKLHIHGADTCAGPFERLASRSGISPGWGGPGAFGAWTEHGLADGQTRCYRVSGENYLGEGALSAPVQATTWVAPSAPVGPSAQPLGDGEVRLRWGAPASTGGGPITGYVIDRTDAAGATVRVATLPAGAREHVDAGLGRSATYGFTVRAVTIVGEGAAATMGATTWGLASAPRDVSARFPALVPTNAEVSWSAPESGAPFLTYRVYRIGAGGGASLVGEVDKSVTRFTDRSLRAETAATYEVRAWNPAGEGAPSGRACTAWPVQTSPAGC